MKLWSLLIIKINTDVDVYIAIFRKFRIDIVIEIVISKHH